MLLLLHAIIPCLHTVGRAIFLRKVRMCIIVNTT